MKLEQAREELVKALEVVASRFESGSDEWRYSLMRTIREYCREIDVETRLLLPIERMLLDVGDETLRAREPSKGGQPAKPLSETLALTYAAAAVTVLKRRGVYSSVSEAVRAVAAATGIERKKLRNFRDSINRHTATPVALKAYDGYVEKIDSWPNPEIIPRLAGYVK